jgi:hypothetical protein
MCGGTIQVKQAVTAMPSGERRTHDEHKRGGFNFLCEGEIEWMSDRDALSKVWKLERTALEHITWALGSAEFCSPFTTSSFRYRTTPV